MTKASDSPRWCDDCQAWGDHHTDRHPTEEGIVPLVRGLVPQQRQRQDSLTDQLRDLHILSARFGMYDAADWLWKQARLGEHPS